MKLFLDTNILLDIVSHRSGETSARIILERCLGPMDRVCISYLSLADMSYILRKHYSTEDLRSILRELSTNMKVLPGLDQHYYDSQKISGEDIEDCLQILCAEYEKCDVIITRNVKDFKDNTLIPVLSPDEFLSHFPKESLSF